MDAFKIGLFVGGAVLAIAAYSFYERSSRRRAETRLASRPQLDAASFGRTYFGESEARSVLAAQLREILVKYVPFPIDGLAPGDALIAELRMDDLDSMSSLEFIIDLEKQYGIKVPDKDSEAIRTFRELVDYLEKRIADANAAK